MCFSYSKEMMRVFKDLEMVEYLGTGIPRILHKYPRPHSYFLQISSVSLFFLKRASWVVKRWSDLAH